MRLLDRDLSTFADELAVESRRLEAEAQAALRSNAATNVLPAGPPVAALPLSHSHAVRRTASFDAGAAPPLAAVLPVPSRAPRTDSVAPSPRRRQLASGDLVAAQTGTDGENWIVATFVGYLAGGRIEVQDDEAEPDTVNRHALDASCVIALPRSASVREERAIATGAHVLAVFPDTTTFYRATVLQAPRRLQSGEFEAYTLQFEDDEATGEGRLVSFSHVVPLPKA